MLGVKNPYASAGDVRDSGSIPGSGRSPGGVHSNPLQYSCLVNPMDRGPWWATVHGVTKSHTWRRWFSMNTIQWVNWRIQYRDSTTNLTKEKKKKKKTTNKLEERSVESIQLKEQKENEKNMESSGNYAHHKKKQCIEWSHRRSERENK